MSKESTGRNLYQRIADIMGECTTLVKAGKNTSLGFTYLREVDVADHMRPLLAKHGLCIIPTIESVERIEAGSTSRGASRYLTKAHVKYQLINVDNPDQSITTSHYGEALDTEDKGLYKALTNCHKYFYLRTFTLGSDDEVEKDEKEERPRKQTQQYRDPGPYAPPPPIERPMTVERSEWIYDTSALDDELQMATEDQFQTLEEKGVKFDAELGAWVSPKPLKPRDPKTRKLLDSILTTREEIARKRAAKIESDADELPESFGVGEQQQLGGR